MASRSLTAPRTRRLPAAEVVAVGLATVVTLTLVLPSYARRPFWFDELVSVEVAGLPPRAFLDYVVGVESNMALYHGLLAPWLWVSGHEAWVRALSIVFAVATLPFLFALAQRLFDRRTAVLAVALMSVNVSYVGYARDTRSYALVLLLVTASSFLLVRGLQDARSRDWALWALTAALAVWAHLFAALVVTAQVAWLVLERRAVPRRQALAAVAGLGALLVPLALAIVVGGQRAQLDWLDRPGLKQLPGLVEWFVESRATVVVYFAGVVVALVTAFRERERRPRASVLLLLWLMLPPGAVFALSYVADPVYLYRYFLVCLPALLLLAAAGFARVRPAWLGIALAALACALSVRTIEGCRPDCKIRHDDWGAALSDLQARMRPGDAIVVYPPEVRTPLDHYLGAERPRLLYPEGWALSGRADDDEEPLDDAMRRVPEHRRVWLVTWWLPAQPARDALSRRATLIDEREFQGDVHLELYRPR